MALRQHFSVILSRCHESLAIIGFILSSSHAVNENFSLSARPHDLHDYRITNDKLPMTHDPITQTGY
jgi:hypothetical protein